MESLAQPTDKEMSMSSRFAAKILNSLPSLQRRRRVRTISLTGPEGLPRGTQSETRVSDVIMM